MSSATLHTITVPRTARYATLGTPETASDWWIVLHGYGQRATDFLDAFAPIATDTRCIVAPEALSRFYVDGMAEHERVGASWMTRVAREDEVGDYVRYLDAVFTQLQNRENAAPSQRTVLGFSQGAATASRWCAYGNASIDRLILWGGTLAHDVDLAEHASTFASLSLAVVIGSDDPYITDARRSAVLDRLAAHDLSVDTHTFAGGHRLDRDVLRRLADASF